MLFRVMMNGEQQGPGMTKDDAAQYVEWLQQENPQATIHAEPILEGDNQQPISFTWWQKFKIYTYAAKLKADAELAKTTPREIFIGILGLVGGIAAGFVAKNEYDKRD